MTLNPPGQYASDRNLGARQRFWRYQEPYFDIVGRDTPGWRLTPATHAFTAESGAAQLATAFASVTVVRPASTPPVVIRDAAVAADYVASLDSHHQDVTARP